MAETPDFLKGFKPEKTAEANERARQELEDALSPDEKAALGLEEPEKDVDLADFQEIPGGDPIMELNLQFLVKLRRKVEEWERKLVLINDSPIKSVGDYKALRKEITLARTEHTNNEDLVNLHGANADKQDLAALKTRIKLIKKELDEGIDSYSKEKGYERHDDIE
jgi:hypothetical protein